jgi:hypothetical protein
VPSLTSADWGKKCDFVAGPDARIPGGKLLIARGDQRSTKFLEHGKPFRISCKEVFDRDAFRHLRGFLRNSRQFAEAPEEQYFYSHCGRDGWHPKIVT